MAFSARLDMDPLKDVRVVDFSYSLSRDYDPTGRPSGGVRGGVIQITVESSSKNELFSWMVSPYKTKTGTIKIADEKSEGASMKEIKFEDAYIVEYSESFHWQGGDNMMESFTITAMRIDIGGAEHVNEWPDR
ncbi:MAG: hypothetical protein K0B05_01625 [Bacteroidales bacterium]|nr:hypothetical protein [Bacteroidales bacterium]